MVVAAVLPFLLAAASFAQVVPPPQLKPVGPPLFVIKVKGQAGFIDPHGKIVIAPTFESAVPFSDGLAAVQQDGVWGFIDTKGRMVIEPRFVTVGSFSDGLASFRDPRKSDSWGYIDKTGKVVIEPRFDCAEEFRNGIARVGFETLESKLLRWIADVGTSCEYRFIDRTGKFVPAPSLTHYATGEPGELIPFTKDGMAGYIDADGRVVIEPKFQYGSAFSDGLACVCQEGLYGYIDKRGTWVIPARFKYPTDFSEGLAGVPLGDKSWGFIDRTGKVVIPARFGYVLNGFRHGVAEVVLDGQRGLINTKGEWVWRPTE